MLRTVLLHATISAEPSGRCPYCNAADPEPATHLSGGRCDPERDAMDDLDDAINALVRRGTDTIEREHALAAILLAGSPFERRP